MRGLVEQLANPHPIVDHLPGLLQDDMFVLRFMAGLDEVLAPVLLAIDDLEAYLDPATAPVDFVEWLADWVGIALDENWSPEQQRALVAGAVDLFDWRGTVRGLSAHVALYSGVVPEIDENGACAWSATPGTPLPGLVEPNLVVRVRVPDPGSLDVAQLDRIVSASKPAHVPHRVEVLPSDRSDPVG
jgi:phage tail-like protein